MAEKADKPEKTRRVISRREVVLVLPEVKAPKFLQGFVDFIREQGVVGLAVGLVLGFAAKTLIDSMVANIFSPVVGLVTGGVSLEDKVLCIDKTEAGACVTKLGYGQFINDLISFLIIVAAVYFVIKGLKLERLDKKKEE